MTIKVTPISGARQEGGGPRCYLLQVDHHKILLDIGVDRVTLDTTAIEAVLQQHALSAVLLSHYDFDHLGGLPLLLSTAHRHKHNHSNSNLLVLATTPVMHLGRQALLDHRLAYRDRFGGDLPPCLRHVEAAIDMIKPLRYSQPIPISTTDSNNASDGDVITVMAMPAGHGLGGAMWRIRRQSASEDMLYAVDFDHRRGVCLDGAAFDLLSRPTCLITDCREALVVAEPRRDRDTAFFATLRQLLVKNNVVLLPIDPADIEVVMMMERWCEEHANAVPCTIHMMTSVSAVRTMDYCKGLLEWMGPAMMRQFDQKRDNPFDFKHIRLDSKLSDLFGTAGPKLILASDKDLHGGPSLQVFLHYAPSSHFHVLFMQEPLVGSVGHELLTMMMHSNNNSSSNNTDITVMAKEAQPLTGNDLIRYKKELREKREQLDAEAAIARHQRRSTIAAADASDSEDESDPDDVDAVVASVINNNDNNYMAIKELYWSDYKTDYWTSISGHNVIYMDPHKLPTTTKCPQFCHKERRSANTDYGQTVPVEWLQAQQQQQQAGSESDTAVLDLVEQARNLIKRRTQRSSNNNPISFNDSDDDESGEPVKWVPVERRVVVKCHRRVVAGYGGRSDGKSLRNIISQLAPRRLLLIGGSPAATDYLYNHHVFAAGMTGLSQVLAPCCGESVELTTSMATVSGSLDESLTESLKVHRHGDHQVGHLMARLSVVEGKPKFAALPDTHRHAIKPVMIGELKLADFRRHLLQRHPHLHCQFDKGDLIVRSGDSMSSGGGGGGVMLRRVDESAWQLEGAAGGVMEAVRSVFYDQLAII